MWSAGKVCHLTSSSQLYHNVIPQWSHEDAISQGMVHLQVILENVQILQTLHLGCSHSSALLKLQHHISCFLEAFLCISRSLACQDLVCDLYNCTVMRALVADIVLLHIAPAPHASQRAVQTYVSFRQSASTPSYLRSCDPLPTSELVTLLSAGQPRAACRGAQHAPLRCPQRRL